MSNAHRVDDISDELWSKIENHLPVLKGKWGRVTKDKRDFTAKYCKNIRSFLADLRNREILPPNTATRSNNSSQIYILE